MSQIRHHDFRWYLALTDHIFVQLSPYQGFESFVFFFTKLELKYIHKQGTFFVCPEQKAEATYYLLKFTMSQMIYLKSMLLCFTGKYIIWCSSFSLDRNLDYFYLKFQKFKNFVFICLFYMKKIVKTNMPLRGWHR